MLFLSVNPYKNMEIHNKITCGKCNIQKEISDFYQSDKIVCKECIKNRVKINRIKAKNKRFDEKYTLIECKACKKILPSFNFIWTAERCNDCERGVKRRNYYKTGNKQCRNYYVSNIKKILLHSAKTRAKKQNVPFNLEIEDIIIPKFCPVLGIELKISNNRANDNSPSLDKVIPELGYVKGNSFVISSRANLMKNGGTAEEHERIVIYIRENSVDNIEYMI